MKVAVIGGGIFGLVIAITLGKKNKVTLFEKQSDVMSGASKCNHNRIHFGFHYPRSIETAKQSLDGYESFYNNFKDSIVFNFPNYYLIEKNGKVTADEYLKFCNNLGLKIKNENPNLDINMNDIIASFLTNEPIFDLNSLKKKILSKCENIKILLNTEIKNKNQLNDFDVIINASYSEINSIRNIFNIENKIIKYQDVIIPIFNYDIDKIGLTIMDGNYCSILPNGNINNSFLLYHVKYSILNENEGVNFSSKKNDFNLNIKPIYENTEKYFKFIKNIKHTGYHRTIRAIPINSDDSRLSIFDVNIIDNKKIINVLSGKITTCWLIADKIAKLI